jgi:hypothetical protein
VKEVTVTIKEVLAREVKVPVDTDDAFEALKRATDEVLNKYKNSEIILDASDLENNAMYQSEVDDIKTDWLEV